MKKTSNSSPPQVPVLKNGYFDVYSLVRDTNYNVYIIIGGRRLGKTFSMLSGLIRDKVQHLYLRRTDADLEVCFTAKKNPYKAVSRETFKDIRLYHKGKDTNIVEFEDEEPVYYYGIGASVSTSGSVRGADMEDIDIMLYDEFINLKPVNTIRKYEGQLFLDLYDTVNNDRDLKGKKPLKAVLLSNANHIDDTLLRTLGLTHIVYTMIMNNESVWHDMERGIYMALLPNDNAITERRRCGAIGRLTQGTSYARMAMENEFVGSYLYDIKEKIDMRAYYPLCAYNDIYFYVNKGDGHIHASWTRSKCPHYNFNTFGEFKKRYGMKIGMQIEGGHMTYQDYNIKIDVSNIF